MEISRRIVVPPGLMPEVSVEPPRKREPQIVGGSLPFIPTSPAHGNAIGATFTVAESPDFRPEEGAVVHVSGTVILGRSIDGGDGWSAAGVLAINEQRREPGRVYAAFDGSGDDLVVIDLDSQQGVAVQQPEGEPERIVAGRRTVVTPGTVIHLGQHRVIVEP